MRLPLITDIQRYSIHDGSGIRTTVFFKGCPLSCLWCHNPETQEFQAQILTYSERCVGCGACVAVCPSQAVQLESMDPEALNLCEKGMPEKTDLKPARMIAQTDGNLCTACGTCVDWCVKNAREICGRTWELSKLEKELLKDRAFYETSGGGVTLSGGEVLAQDMDYVEALLSRLRHRGICVNIDTCGDVPYEAIARVLPYTDVFLYDFKVADEKTHRACTGRSNRRILENLERLSRSKAKIWIRIPVIGTVNDAPDSIAAIGGWLKEHQIQPRQIHLLPYHNTGSSKYPRAGRKYEGNAFTTPDREHIEALKQVMESFGLAPVQIGG